VTSASRFYEVLVTLVGCIATNRFALTTLGILVEQSRTLLNEDNLTKLFVIIEKNLPGFHYRETFEKAVLLASVNKNLKIELHTTKVNLLSRKLSLTTALFFFAAPELVSSEKKLSSLFCSLLHMLSSSSTKLSISRISNLPSFTAFAVSKNQAWASDSYNFVSCWLFTVASPPAKLPLM
jgi:hypothetical protein